MSLARRLKNAEEKLAPSGARYVVADEQERRRVAALFLSISPDTYARFRPPGSEPPEEPSRDHLPPEQRMTYASAVEEGIIVETDAFKAWRHCKARGEARGYYREYRRRIEERERVGDHENAARYAAEITKAPEAESRPYVFFRTTLQALIDEAGCPDALSCRERLEHYRSSC